MASAPPVLRWLPGVTWACLGETPAWWTPCGARSLEWEVGTLETGNRHSRFELAGSKAEGLLGYSEDHVFGTFVPSNFWSLCLLNLFSYTGQTERVLGNPGQRAEEDTVTVQRAASASCASGPDVPSHRLGSGWGTGLRGERERCRPPNKSKHLSLRVCLVLCSGPGFCWSF